MVALPAGERSAGATGVVLMLSSCALLTLGDAVSKLLTESYPVGQVLFVRSVIVCAIVGIVCVLRGRTAQLVPRNLRAQLWRGAWFAAATFCFVWSISVLPLPMVSAIMFSAPIILTALAGPVLGERVGWRRWLAVCVGFGGILIIVNPFGGGWTAVMLLPVVGAFITATRDLVTRHVAVGETTLSILFISMAVTLVPAAATAPFGWQMPGLFHAVLLVAVGLVHGAALYLQIAAFQAAEAGLLAPYKYSMIIWSTLLAFLIWGDVPSPSTILGASVVILSGVFIYCREARTGR